ncbi:helix-turn-helix domain-containing protein [Iocasia frigidifontis]|uniref:Helix-turn-helix domain-containing protein n=1 Tax=Iocasia fonsfrigidae TaxID=2682810 RepID=A0A8A7K9K7_9FIRM|nr:helix-turn-helix transcriptional regulator [Iocasia fonsfrigidae]QTL97910.1 helix-turn-helix domain-containing protein [Iocasia fonsfrigidae]
MTLGKRICKLRKKNGLKQEDLGKKLKVVKSTISLYENDVNIPDINKIKKLAEIFEVSLEYLLFGKKQSDLINKLRNLTENNSELENLLSCLADRKDLLQLLQETKSLSPGEIEKLIRIIKIVKEKP